MRLSGWVDRFIAEERTVGQLLQPAELCAQAVAAASFYAAYGAIDAETPALAPGPLHPVPAISVDTEISLSEWALIRPLFLLYVAREEARLVDASRLMGADLAYDRSSGEIAADIAQLEEALPKKAFCQPIITV